MTKKKSKSVQLPNANCYDTMPQTAGSACPGCLCGIMGVNNAHSLHTEHVWWFDIRVSWLVAFAERSPYDCMAGQQVCWCDCAMYPEVRCFWNCDVFAHTHLYSWVRLWPADVKARRATSSLCATSAAAWFEWGLLFPENAGDREGAGKWRLNWGDGETEPGYRWAAVHFQSEWGNYSSHPAFFSLWILSLPLSSSLPVASDLMSWTGGGGEMREGSRMQEPGEVSVQGTRGMVLKWSRTGRWTLKLNISDRIPPVPFGQASYSMLPTGDSLLKFNFHLESSLIHIVTLKVLSVLCDFITVDGNSLKGPGNNINGHNSRLKCYYKTGQTFPLRCVSTWVHVAFFSQHTTKIENLGCYWLEVLIIREADEGNQQDKVSSCF